MYDTHDTGKPLKFVCMQYNPEGRGLLMFKTFFINFLEGRGYRCSEWG